MMTQRWGDFCTWCGAALQQTNFPRTCPNGHVTYLNGQPVGVALQPVWHDGHLHLLVVKRGIEPFIGQYALPGGFKDNDETFAQCAARELFEETGIRHMDGVRDTFWQAVGTLHRSGTDPRLPYLQFEVMPTLDAQDINLTYTSSETNGLSLISYDDGCDTLVDTTNTPVTLCFPLHDQAARLWLSRHRHQCESYSTT
jgi:ADP-ribose pyrophosphatase YjhB (NUDIX family)